MVIPLKNGNPVGVPFWVGMWDLGGTQGTNLKPVCLTQRLKKS